MSKYIIKEGSLTKFVTKVFDNILRKKQKANLKAMKNDPELAKMTKKLEKDVDEFVEYLKKNKKV